MKLIYLIRTTKPLMIETAMDTQLYHNRVSIDAFKKTKHNFETEQTTIYHFIYTKGQQFL